MALKKDKVLTMTNAPDWGGVVYANDRGVWNVTKAVADCNAGKYKVYGFPPAEIIEANSSCEFDPEKVLRLSRSAAALIVPGIAVIEDGLTWLIDGQHRVRAFQLLGLPAWPCYVIDEASEPQYRVLFNGARLPPFEIP